MTPSEAPFSLLEENVLGARKPPETLEASEDRVGFDFQGYKTLFETRVIVQGVLKGSLGQIEKVSIKPGNLARSEFGAMLGAVLASNEVLVIDYYGHKKFSQGLLDLIEQTRSKASWGQIRHVECFVVHFAAIKFEDVSKLAPDLLLEFSDFKQQILKARGFNHVR